MFNCTNRWLSVTIHRVNGINRWRSFSSIRNDSVTAKHWLVNSNGIVRKKTNYPVCTHMHMNEAATLTKILCQSQFTTLASAASRQRRRRKTQSAKFRCTICSPGGGIMKRNLPLKSSLWAHMSMPSKLIAWLSHLNRMKCYENGACLAQMLGSWKSPWKMELEDKMAKKKSPLTKYLRGVGLQKKPSSVADAERYPRKQANLL